jgi:hypothetical protein
MLTIDKRNVNYALPTAMHYLTKWSIEVSPRGQKTLEFPEPVCTTYHRPKERVLFDPVRDANPFFHLMESLWILGGRRDVAWITQYNTNLKQYSDDGVTYHGAYGYRLRNCGIDQIDEVVKKFKQDPDTRQAVLQIWDFTKDLQTDSKDLPCNDMVFLKLRDGHLNMTVCNRSNDVIWGAYGANVVQFSMLLEYLAARIGCKMGVYNQVSDSFHVYTDNPQWEKLKDMDPVEPKDDLYTNGTVRPYPLVDEPSVFDKELQLFLEGIHQELGWDNEFFPQVAIPMAQAWRGHKETKTGHFYLGDIKATDWRYACKEWLRRRGDHA